jgi:predicted RNA binding protein YcfA (HicA-like mRNA interferase family)
MNYGELKKLLRKSGNNQFHHQGARHEIWVNTTTGEQYPVGRHNSDEVKKKTLASIKKSAGLK